MKQQIDTLLNSVVALGIVQDSGTTTVTWCVPAKLANGSLRCIKTTTQYNSWQDCILLHGHGGKTFIQFDDTLIMISDLDVLAAEKIVA